MKHIVSLSGGKDSTAMLLMMIEKGMQIDEIVFCDTGKEFPQMYDHIEKVEKYIGREITKIRNERYSFEYLLGHIKTKRGQGRGWADFQMRWCTGEVKVSVINKYLRKYKEKERLTYIGIAYDEQKRIIKHIDKKHCVYPLNKWKITEKEALHYCYSRGFHWDGLYEKLERVSCYCCPLQKINDLRVLYNEFPELWKDIRRLDKLSWRDFRAEYTLDELENKFDNENLRKDKPFGLYEDRVEKLLKIEHIKIRREHKEKNMKGKPLSFDIFKELSLSNCNYCGNKHSIELEDRANGRLYGHILSDKILHINTISRIDNEYGYTDNNSSTCCKDCLGVKNTMSDNKFYEWLKNTYEYNNKKQGETTNE